MNDAVLFRSERFSLEPPMERGVPYDLPLGDDMASLIRDRINRDVSGARAGDPVREDWGTVFDLVTSDGLFLVEVHWVGYQEAENRWGITFSQPRGCLGSLFGGRSDPEVCRAAQEIVARILAEDPETFLDVEWMDQISYEARM
jgi:hypothetical protein